MFFLAPNQHFRMISERSRDTEDWRLEKTLRI